MKKSILSLFVLATISMNVACKGEKNENGEVQIEEVKLAGKKQDPKEELNKQLSTGMFNSINSTIFIVVSIIVFFIFVKIKHIATNERLIKEIRK